VKLLNKKIHNKQKQPLRKWFYYQLVLVLTLLPTSLLVIALLKDVYNGILPIEGEYYDHLFFSDILNGLSEIIWTFRVYDLLILVFLLVLLLISCTVIILQTKREINKKLYPQGDY
jgi:hypothetical protein